MSEKEGDGVDDIVVDRSCIECDKCGVGSPQKRCARCGSYYYCSKECQVQHWKQHKPACTIIKEMHDDWKEKRNKTLPDGSALDTKEGPCAICLEETITNPVVLPCGHVFCFSCVGQYQCASELQYQCASDSESESDEASCPYCRGEIPNVMKRARDRMTLYWNRAMASSNGSDEQKKYAKLALAEYDSNFDLLEQVGLGLGLNVSAQEKLVKMKNCFFRATIMERAGMPEETVKVTKEVLSLVEKYPGVLDRDEVSDTKQYLAEAYSAIGKWEDASAIYSSLCGENLHRRELPSWSIAMGLSRAMYETGKYDQAIEVASLGIEVNRTSCGAHKYVALSQKAKGEIAEAKQTISRAILYEEHWDKDNLNKNKQILKELNDL